MLFTFLYILKIIQSNQKKVVLYLKHVFRFSKFNIIIFFRIDSIIESYMDDYDHNENYNEDYNDYNRNQSIPRVSNAQFKPKTETIRCDWLHLFAISAIYRSFFLVKEKNFIKRYITYMIFSYSIIP